MGKGQSTISQDKDITNTETFRNAVKKSVKVLNTMNTTLTQKQLTDISGTTIITQELKFDHIVTAGNFVVSDAYADAEIKMNYSVLANNTMKQDMVDKLTQEIQDGIKNLTTSTQEQLTQQGEPIFADLIGDLTDSMNTGIGDITGSSNTKSQDLTIAQIMNLNNETEIDQKIKNTVNTHLVNSMVTKLSDTILGSQSIDFSNITAGNVYVTHIGTKMLGSIIQKSITSSELSEQIVSNFTGTSLTTVENANKATEKQTQKEETAIDDVGEGVAKDIKAAGDAGSKLVLAAILPWVIGGVALLCFLLIGAYFFKDTITSVITGKPPEKEGGSESESSSESERDEGDEDSGSGIDLTKVAPTTIVPTPTAFKTTANQGEPNQTGAGKKRGRRRRRNAPYLMRRETNRKYIENPGTFDFFFTIINGINNNPIAHKIIDMLVILSIVAVCLFFTYSYWSYYYPKVNYLKEHYSYVNPNNPQFLMLVNDMFVTSYNHPVFLSSDVKKAEKVNYQIDYLTNKMWIYKVKNGITKYLRYERVMNRFFFTSYQNKHKNMYYFDYEWATNGFYINWGGNYMCSCGNMTLTGSKNKKEMVKFVDPVILV